MVLNKAWRRGFTGMCDLNGKAASNYLLTAALLLIHRRSQLDSIECRAVKRNILAGNVPAVVYYFAVPFEPGMCLKLGLCIARHTDANISRYAPAS